MAEQRRQQQDQTVCDVLIFGATGATGREIAKYAATQYGKNSSNGNVRFGLGGSNMGKLQQLRDELAKLDSSVKEWPLIAADSTNQQQADEAVRKTHVLCNAAGPFHKFATTFIDACVRQGVDYVDISGETHWIKNMIDKYHNSAQEKGVYIVPACGFVATPFDLGTLLVERVIRERAERELEDVKAFLYDSVVEFSGGSRETYIDMLLDKRASRLVRHPYILNPVSESPDTVRPEEKDKFFIGFDRQAGFWTLPSLLALSDTRIVRRSIALRHQNYTYNEVNGVRGFFRAVFNFIGMVLMFLVMYFSFTRNLMNRFVWSRQTGHTKEVLEKGKFNIKLVGKGRARGVEAPRYGYVSIHGNYDVAARGTARCVLEAAISLAMNKDEIRKESHQKGGLLTPSFLGMTLVERLKRAGMRFEIRLDEPPIAF